MSTTTTSSNYGVSPLHRALKRFRANPVAMASLFVLIVIFLIAVIFAIFRFTKINWPADPNETNLAAKLLPPSPDHWLGTDNLGRDVLTRMLHGSYISLTVGFVAVAVQMTIGIVVGAVAGYFRGWIDNVLMRIVDALMCFPTFFLILTVVALLGPNMLNIVFVIGLLSWTGIARLVRAEFLTLREMQYVSAARTLGQKKRWIIFRHILPNAMAPVLVSAVLGIPAAIMTEAGLSYLGFGVQPPQATWGNIISDGKTYFLDAWWLIFFPGMAIFITLFAFYMAAESFRRALSLKGNAN